MTGDRADMRQQLLAMLELDELLDDWAIPDRRGPALPKTENTVEPKDHDYLSTGCLHGEHEYCQSSTGAAGTKIPAQCKFCGARCQCACHETDRQAA